MLGNFFSAWNFSGDIFKKYIVGCVILTDFNKFTILRPCSQLPGSEHCKLFLFSAMILTALDFCLSTKTAVNIWRASMIRAGSNWSFQAGASSITSKSSENSSALSFCTYSVSGFIKRIWKFNFGFKGFSEKELKNNKLFYSSNNNILDYSLMGFY